MRAVLGVDIGFEFDYWLLSKPQSLLRFFFLCFLISSSIRVWRQKGVIVKPYLTIPQRFFRGHKIDCWDALISQSYANYASGTTPRSNDSFPIFLFPEVFLLLEVIVWLWITCPRNDNCAYCVFVGGIEMLKEHMSLIWCMDFRMW